MEKEFEMKKLKIIEIPLLEYIYIIFNVMIMNGFTSLRKFESSICISLISFFKSVKDEVVFLDGSIGE